MKWQCAWCGREYDDKQESCGTCGHEAFESIEAGSPSPFESGSLVWACTNCGREHVKRSPPCSRCGNHDLEKREADDADLTDDVSSPGYLSVGAPYLVGVVAVVAVVGLALAGVVPIPGLSGPPSPPDAPGEGDRSAGLDLALVESELHERFEADRQSSGVAERGRDEGLDAFAEYATRHRVAERYDPDYDGSVPDLGAFDPQCTTSPVFGIAEPSVDITDFDDEAAFADALASSLVADSGFAETVRGEYGVEGLDVHVGPDGTVFVGYIAC